MAHLLLMTMFNRSTTAMSSARFSETERQLLDDLVLHRGIEHTKGSLSTYIYIIRVGRQARPLSGTNQRLATKQHYVA
jgi:hypothetical protein